jgi:TPR repeat protein
MAKPAEPKPAAEAPKQPDGAELFQKAAALESQGKVAEAVNLYKQAARAKHGPSAKKAGDIYAGGKGDVPPDYSESLRWHGLARSLGETIGTAKGR